MLKTIGFALESNKKTSEFFTDYHSEQTQYFKNIQINQCHSAISPEWHYFCVRIASMPDYYFMSDGFANANREMEYIC